MLLVKYGMEIKVTFLCVQDPKCAAADDIFPDGTEVKKGNMVMYAPYAMGRLPSIWGPDATEFRPERWLVNGVVQQESPFKFVTFQVSNTATLGILSFWISSFALETSIITSKADFATYRVSVNFV